MRPYQVRVFTATAHQLFLFGPRGTGKTAWLRTVLPEAHWVDLLLERELVRLTRDPGRFSEEVETLPPGRWIVVDEVQRLPALLDQAQHLLVQHPRRWRFALAESSARGLKRDQANLLAGRVINRRFFPAFEGDSAFKRLYHHSIRHLLSPPCSPSLVPD